MRVVLGRLVAAQRTEQGPARDVPLGYLGRLARSFDQNTAVTQRNAAQRTPVAPGLVEPLSQREIEVLRLLAAGKSNQQIARELVVSLQLSRNTSPTC